MSECVCVCVSEGVSVCAAGWGGGVLSGPVPEEGIPGGRTWWRYRPHSTPLHRVTGMAEWESAHHLTITPLFPFS